MAWHASATLLPPWSRRCMRWAAAGILPWLNGRCMRYQVGAEQPEWVPSVAHRPDGRFRVARMTPAGPTHAVAFPSNAEKCPNRLPQSLAATRSIRKLDPGYASVTVRGRAGSRPSQPSRWPCGRQTRREPRGLRGSARPDLPRRAGPVAVVSRSSSSWAARPRIETHLRSRQAVLDLAVPDFHQHVHAVTDQS
jgi:hypothetical protein